MKQIFKGVFHRMKESSLLKRMGEVKRDKEFHNADTMKTCLIFWVANREDGEWMNYTVSIPTDGDYTVYLVYQSKGNSLLSVASDSEVKTEPMQLPSSIQWTEREIGKLTLPAGACVLRLQIEQAGDKLEIQKIIVK